jgi:hypothetical protein
LHPLPFCPRSKIEQVRRRLIRKIADNISIETRLDFDGAGEENDFGLRLTKRLANMASRAAMRLLRPLRLYPTIDASAKGS